MRSSLDYFSAILEGVESFWWWTLLVFAAWQVGVILGSFYSGDGLVVTLAPLLLVLWPFAALVGGWWASIAGMVAMACWLVPAYLGLSRLKPWAVIVVVACGAGCAVAIGNII